MVEPYQLDGLAALAVAQTQKLRKLPDEKDTAFVKRIVCAYLNAAEALALHPVSRPVTQNRSSGEA